MQSGFCARAWQAKLLLFKKKKDVCVIPLAPASERLLIHQPHCAFTYTCQVYACICFADITANGCYGKGQSDFQQLSQKSSRLLACQWVTSSAFIHCHGTLTVVARFLCDPRAANAYFLNQPCVSHSPGYSSAHYDGSITRQRNCRGCQCVSISSCTHSDDSLAEAERTSAAVLGLVLRFVVAQGVVFQDDPAVLPAMDIICPLET